METETNMQSSLGGVDVAKLRRFKKITLGIVIMITILAGLFYFKGLFIAATINGSPVSRLAVIAELETQGGAQALDVLITKKLIIDAYKSKGMTVSTVEVDEEIRLIEEQVATQGTTLEESLRSQGISMDSFREQVQLQVQIEKMLGDTILVTDEDVETFITQNNIPIPETNPNEFRGQIFDQIRDQKINEEAGILIGRLRDEAEITYYKEY